MTVRELNANHEYEFPAAVPVGSSLKVKKLSSQLEGHWFWSLDRLSVLPSVLTVNEPVRKTYNHHDSSNNQLTA